MVINLTDGMRKVIKDLVDVQQESINYLIKDDKYTDDVWDILQHYQLDREELRASLRVSRVQWADLYNEPLLIGALNKADLSLLKHILFQIEVGYSANYQKDIRLLWGLLFQLTEELDVRIKLTLNTYKHGKRKECKNS